MSDTENPPPAVGVQSSALLRGHMAHVFMPLERELTSPEVRQFEDFLKMAVELYLRHLVA